MINSNSNKGERNPLPLSSVAQVWNYREKIEIEASDQFSRLAFSLQQLKANPTVIGLCKKAAKDEDRHATLCRKIIMETGHPIPRRTPQVGMLLGPFRLDQRKRALYSAVAISCVTETLSTALLLEMQKRAEPETVKKTVRTILEDEISHSRIGWAHLASEAETQNVSWLAPHISEMIQEAIQGEVPSMVAPASTNEDLSTWGILPRADAKEIIQTTITQVIRPGLIKFGIQA